MEQHTFKSHEDYVNAQEKTMIARGKSPIFQSDEQKRKICFTRPKTVDLIKKYHKFSIKLAICHGVRSGLELDMFRDVFNEGKWIGTEIVEELCDGENIIYHDFSAVKEEWVGKVDFIYTNSLDHSRYPEDTIKTWLESLVPNGRIYIEWTIWHDKLGRGRNKADCFAASFNEYRDMFEEIGEVEDVLSVSDVSVNSIRYKHHIFVVKNFS